MDVRKKFFLSLAALALFLISFSVLVYIMATTGPFQESTEDDFPNDSQVFDDGVAVARRGEQDISTPEDVQIPATVTLEDSRSPEEQLRQPPDIDVAPDEMLYIVRMHSSWGEKSHPLWHVSGSHLSPMVVWSHRIPGVVFREGYLASNGMEVMAETGGTSDLVSELNRRILIGDTFHYATGTVFFTPGDDEVYVKVARDVPLVSAVSMIAPSPDWFVAVTNVRLGDGGGQWVERLSVPAVLYDAGTDDGTTFTAQDLDADPKQPITRIDTAPVIPISWFEFVRYR